MLASPASVTFRKCLPLGYQSRISLLFFEKTVVFAVKKFEKTVLFDVLKLEKTVPALKIYEKIFHF